MTLLLRIHARSTARVPHPTTKQADEAPGTVPGDIMFLVQEKEHELFKRKGNDLFMEKTLSLTEVRAAPHFHFSMLLRGCNGR